MTPFANLVRAAILGACACGTAVASAPAKVAATSGPRPERVLVAVVVHRLEAATRCSVGGRHAAWVSPGAPSFAVELPLRTRVAGASPGVRVPRLRCDGGLAAAPLPHLCLVSQNAGVLAYEVGPVPLLGAGPGTAAPGALWPLALFCVRLTCTAAVLFAGAAAATV